MKLPNMRRGERVCDIEFQSCSQMERWAILYTAVAADCLNRSNSRVHVRSFFDLDFICVSNIPNTHLQANTTCFMGSTPLNPNLAKNEGRLLCHPRTHSAL